MKRICKVVAILLIVSTLLTSLTYAQEVTAQPRASNYISNLTCGISHSERMITIRFSVTGTQTLSELGASEIILMRSPNGVDSWRQQAVFTFSTHPSLRTTNSSYYSSYVTHQGYYYSYYYAMITLYGKLGNEGTTRITFTNTIRLA